MKILFLIFSMIAVVLGFVGLITIIKGFVDRSNKKIWLGTFFICIVLILGVLGAYYIGDRALQSKRFHDNERLMMKKCADMPDFGMFRHCCPGDSTTTGDSTCMKMVIEKKCIKKEGGMPCPHHSN
ncbi:MAG TPA: DUF4149 domain-containing protein [Bacteroidales bacterium]|nr:DUF4149 domain-containing protein [Bacteroidales bacterium]